MQQDASRVRASSTPARMDACTNCLAAGGSEPRAGFPFLFIPIARTPMLVPSLVGLLDWSFQPHLDQMQHGSVDDPSSNRLYKVGMRNRIAANLNVKRLCRRRTLRLGDASHWVEVRSMDKFAIWAQVEAKPGKEQEVAHFLKSAQALAERESGTTRWY